MLSLLDDAASHKKAHRFDMSGEPHMTSCSNQGISYIRKLAH